MRQKMVCIACGREVEEKMTFCPYCGQTEFKMIEGRASDALNNPNPIDNSSSDNSFNSSFSDAYNMSYDQTERISNYNDSSYNNVSPAYGNNMQPPHTGMNMDMQSPISTSQSGGLTTTHKIIIAAVSLVVVAIVAVVGINVSKGNKSESSTKKTVNAEAKKKIGKLKDKFKISALDIVGSEEEQGDADTGNTGTGSTTGASDSASDVSGGNSDTGVQQPSVTSESNTQGSKVEFLTGSIAGSEYSNQWLGIRVPIPQGYEVKIDTNVDAITKSGFYVQNPSTASTFSLYFINIASEPNITTDVALNQLRNGMLDEGTYEKIENGMQTIQGIDYVCEHCKTNIDGYDVYVSNYVGKYDNRLIIFSILNTAGSIDENKGYMNNIQAY